MSQNYEDDFYIYHHLEISKYENNNIMVECLTCGESKSMEDTYEDFEQNSDVYEKEFLDEFCLQHRFCLNEDSQYPSAIITYKPLKTGVYCSKCSKKIQDITTAFIKRSENTEMLYLYCFDCAKDDGENIFNILKYNYYKHGWDLYCSSFIISTDEKNTNLNIYKRFNVLAKQVKIFQNPKKSYHKVLDRLFMVDFNAKSVSDNK